MRKVLIPSLLAASLVACNQNGMSTNELESAAVAKAREQLKLPAGTPLEAKVWVGKEHDGKPVMCGTVSDRPPGSAVPPQRFAATTEPLQWLVFEDAHAPQTVTRPDVYGEWAVLCGGEQAG